MDNDANKAPVSQIPKNGNLPQTNVEESMAPERKSTSKILYIILALVLVVAVTGSFFAVQWFIGNRADLKADDKKDVIENPDSEGDNDSSQGSKAELSIFYLYHQDPSVWKIYRADLKNQNRLEVGHDEGSYSDGGTFVESSFSTSGDGKSLARWTGEKLEVAPTKEPNSFTKIAETLEKDTSISSVIWSSDSKKIAYVVTKYFEPDAPFGGGKKGNSLYVSEKDGLNTKLVKRFELNTDVSLQGYNSLKNELYWSVTGHGGGLFDFTILDLNSGVIKSGEHSDLTSDVFIDRIQFSKDFSKAYVVKKDRQIVEYTFSTRDSKIVYELKDTGKDESGNISILDRVLISPVDDSLVFLKRVEPGDKESILLLDLSSGRVEILLDDPKYYNSSPHSWSPDGKYLYLAAWCGNCGNEEYYYLMDVKSKEVSLFFEQEMTEEYKESKEGYKFKDFIRLLGWGL